MVVLILLFLGAFSKEEVSMRPEPLRNALKGIISLGMGVTAFLVAFVYNSNGGPKPLKDFFLENSWELARGKNVVNVILVDFRGFDTLGEVSVLAIAMLGVVGLLVTGKGKDTFFIPSPILSGVVRFSFFVINLFGFYLLLRGHNFPGGGFIGGLCASIAVILLGMVMPVEKVKSLLKIDLIKIAFSGLLLLQ